MVNAKPVRAMVYIDGFNLYHGMCECELRHLLWLDLAAMSNRLLHPSQTLVGVKYFTARISGGKPTDRPDYRQERDAKKKRQDTYLNAIRTFPAIELFFGQYRDNPMECNKCGATWVAAQEKMTDVNIATEMIFDAFANRYDAAILVSGDSDLSAPIRRIKEHLGGKRINIAFPPARYNAHLKQLADSQALIHDRMLKKCQLPDPYVGPNGYKIAKPAEWTKAGAL